MYFKLLRVNFRLYHVRFNTTVLKYPSLRRGVPSPVECLRSDQTLTCLLILISLSGEKKKRTKHTQENHEIKSSTNMTNSATGVSVEASAALCAR